MPTETATGVVESQNRHVTSGLCYCSEVSSAVLTRRLHILSAYDSAICWSCRRLTSGSVMNGSVPALTSKLSPVTLHVLILMRSLAIEMLLLTCTHILIYPVVLTIRFIQARQTCPVQTVHSFCLVLCLLVCSRDVRMGRGYCHVRVGPRPPGLTACLQLLEISLNLYGPPGNFCVTCRWSTALVSSHDKTG